MKLYRMVLILVFGTGFALAQNPPSTPPTFPSQQQQPTTQHPDEAAGQASASSTDLVKAQSDIQSALRKQLPASADSVTVSSTADNKIQLSGAATSETEKNQVEQIARTAAPNVEIVNKITVAASPSGPTTTPPNPTMNPEDKTGAEKPTPPEQQRKPMPPMGSSFMAQSSSPQNPSTPPSGAQSGTTTPAPAQETSAASSTDAQSNIQKALQQDPTLANANIAVNVSGNKVELTGTVANKEQKKTAKEIAESHAGGMKVVDHLKVEGSPKGGKDTSAPPK